MKKIKPYLFPMIAALALLYAMISMKRMQPKVIKDAPPLTPAIKPYQDSIGALGMLEPNTENISVGSELNGTIAKVFVRVGQEVMKGAPLFKIDTRQLEADLKIKEGQLLVARARVKSSQAQTQDVNSQWKAAESLEDKRSLSSEELNRRKFASQSANAKLEESKADVLAMQAQVQAIRVELDRSVVKAPISGTILKLNARLGEFASSNSKELLVMGNVHPLYVRVDVDEADATKVRPESLASATPRGNTTQKVALEFVRFEPFVIPKKSLTGDSTERVDTRVLQVIYKVKGESNAMFVGQLLDVFIEKVKS